MRQKYILLNIKLIKEMLEELPEDAVYRIYLKIKSAHGILKNPELYIEHDLLYDKTKPNKYPENES